jgi:hypothetical protein
MVTGYDDELLAVRQYFGVSHPGFDGDFAVDSPDPCGCKRLWICR